MIIIIIINYIHIINLNVAPAKIVCANQPNANLINNKLFHLRTSSTSLDDIVLSVCVCVYVVRTTTILDAVDDNDNGTSSRIRGNGI